MSHQTEERPISQSLEDWLARRDEDKPLPPGMQQQDFFDGLGLA